MTDLPAEAVEAAGRALRDLRLRNERDHKQVMTEILTAAYPHIAAAVRREVAEQIAAALAQTRSEFFPEPSVYSPAEWTAWLVGFDDTRRTVERVLARGFAAAGAAMGEGER